MKHEYVATSRICGLEHSGAGEKSDGTVADTEAGDLVELDESVAEPFVKGGSLKPYVDDEVVSEAEAHAAAAHAAAEAAERAAAAADEAARVAAGK